MTKTERAVLVESPITRADRGLRISELVVIEIGNRECPVRPMSHAPQADLFGNEPETVPSYLPDPDKVRSELRSILARAKAAPNVPWKPSEQNFYRLVFPQMTNWLPDDEAKQLRFEFEQELERLLAA